MTVVTKSPGSSGSPTTLEKSDSAMIACLFRTCKVRFIWGIAHDQDVDPKIRQVNKASLYTLVSNHLMFKLASKLLLKYADEIICQTNEQIAYIKKYRSENQIHLIPNICELAGKSYCPLNQNNDTCLWVGKFSGTKGEAELLCLAKSMPYIKFIAVGHVTPDFQNTTIYRNISNQPNIDCVGRLDHPTLLQLYGKVPLLVHTAPSEGFSNAFLEAWSFGIPIVSFQVDPNALLSTERLGMCSGGDIDLMRIQIDKLLNNLSLRETMGRVAQKYIVENHSSPVIMKQFEELFEDFYSK